MGPHIIAPSYALVSLTSEPFCSKLPIMLVNERLNIFMPIVPKTLDFCQKKYEKFCTAKCTRRFTDRTSLPEVRFPTHNNVICASKGVQKI